MKLKFDPFTFDQCEVLGVPVYFKQLPWVNECVHFRLIVKTGARHDPIGKEGLAHFFEHLPFTGCRLFPTIEDVEKVGRTYFMGTLNAGTSAEYTNFTGMATREDMYKAASFLSNLVANPLLETKEVERERSVILQELWRKYENYKRIALEKRIWPCIYHNHTLGRFESPVGWPETVASITHDEFLAFHKRHYHRGNVVVVLAGAVSEDDCVALAKRCLEEMPDGERSQETNKLSGLWPAPTESLVRISAKEYFECSEESRPMYTQFDTWRVMHKSDSLVIQSLLVRLLQKILVREVRGKLGGTYSPSVQVEQYQDLSSVCLSLKIKPSLLSASKQIVADTLSAIGSETSTYAPLFEENRQASIKLNTTSDYTADTICDVVTAALSSENRIVSATEFAEDLERATYEQVCSIVARELRPELLFQKILEP